MPVAILLILWTFRIQEPNRKLAVIVFMISSGVALASHGELRFNLVGFLTQAAAVAVCIPPRFELCSVSSSLLSRSIISSKLPGL